MSFGVMKTLHELGNKKHLNLLSPKNKRPILTESLKTEFGVMKTLLFYRSPYLYAKCEGRRRTKAFRQVHEDMKIVIDMGPG
jgi:hypothetical protein